MKSTTSYQHLSSLPSLSRQSLHHLKFRFHCSLLNHRPQQQHPVPTPRKLPPTSLTSKRSKSPKPPKPTAAETEYPAKSTRMLGQGRQTHSMPCLILFRTLICTTTIIIYWRRKIDISKPGGSAQGVWLGMSQFRGIDVCLRMFTAVEVLDGENMVGCRMCRKIANEVDLKGNELRDGEERTLKHASPLRPCPRPR